MKRDIFIRHDDGKLFSLVQHGTAERPICMYCDKPIPKRAREDWILSKSGKAPPFFHSKECATAWAVYIVQRLATPAGEV